MATLSEYLDRMTHSGELLESAAEPGALRCVACGHRCLIRPGRRGICQVRFNQDGELRVPWGYVAAAQLDPIEKKPFSHVLPGAKALTFGMLGCDFHCGYCFSGDTMVVTNRGPISLAELFLSADQVRRQPDGEIAYPDSMQAVTGSGSLHTVKGVFKHPYHGKFVTIKPYYLPEIHCTADHRIYATDDPASPPALIQAKDLTLRHYLAVPSRFTSLQAANGDQRFAVGDQIAFVDSEILYTDKILADYEVTYTIHWKLPQQDREAILEATAKGETSRTIGAALGKDPSYIRHIRSKAAMDLIHTSQTSGPIIEEDYLRFPKEHHPGIPLRIPLDARMASLLGYFCAEGSVVMDKDRPNSAMLNFSFSRRETGLADEVMHLLKDCLEVQGRLVPRETTLAVTVSKSSAALLFKSLCGSKAAMKRVPEALFRASPQVRAAFINSYVTGDGHRSDNGKTSVTTVSKDLAYGVAWLVLGLGYMPSIYEYAMSEAAVIQGRKVRRSPRQFTVAWYTGTEIERKVRLAGDFYLVPLRSLVSSDYEGDVYNMEVEGEHQYLANFCLVSNCQNWLTSQALKDPSAEAGARDYVQPVTPTQFVALARRMGAEVIASSYNEPLITSEWAVSVFKPAIQAGIRCTFVSNGNATREALDYLRPYLTAYKVDLKSMNDKHYRELGGVLQHVLDTIRMVHDLGLWIEVVTLVIPGFNDSPEELWDAARFLVSVSPDIPWHVTAFHPDYKMQDRGYTTAAMLQQAAEIGQEAGLHYVYAGNLPGRVGSLEDTHCPGCNTPVIRRRGYTIIENKLLATGGKCPKCGTLIAGVWN